MEPSSSGESILCGVSCRKRFRPDHADFLEEYRYEIQLPPELWIIIFEYLDHDSKLQLRLTCHRWKDIVDGYQCLRKKFAVTFEDVVMDKKYRPESLFPASQACLNQSYIFEVDLWWPQFGARLTKLDLYFGQISLSNLFGMLRQTPNLTVLILSQTLYTPDEEPLLVDFRLEKLKMLEMRDESTIVLAVVRQEQKKKKMLMCWSIFNVFVQICPRLSTLNMYLKPMDQEEEIVCRMLQSVQYTLKELSCYFTPRIINQISELNQLQLTKVDFSGEEGLATHLSRLQTSIQYLTFNGPMRELCEIGRNLTKLNRIKIFIPEDDNSSLSFLANMPHLTRLFLRSCWMHQLELGVFNSQNLKKVELMYVDIGNSVLLTFLKQCPNLEDLDIASCVIDSWSDVFIKELQPLRRLVFGSNKVRHASVSIADRQYNFNELVVYRLKLSIDLLVQFILQCHRLRKLRLQNVESVTDEVVSVVSQCPNLTELTIYGCPITEASIDFVIKNCPHLRLDIPYSERISDAALKRLM